MSQDNTCLRGGTDIARLANAYPTHIPQKIVRIQQNGARDHTYKSATTIEDWSRRHDRRLVLIERTVGLADNGSELLRGSLEILPATDIVAFLSIRLRVLGKNPAFGANQVKPVEQVTQGSLTADQNAGANVQDILAHTQTIGDFGKDGQALRQFVVQLSCNETGNGDHFGLCLGFQFALTDQRTGNCDDKRRQKDNQNDERNGTIYQATQPAFNQHSDATPGKQTRDNPPCFGW